MITITITKDENQYIAGCKSLNIFGELRHTAVDALLDLAKFMKDDYESLLKYKDRLSNGAQDSLNQYDFKSRKERLGSKRGEKKR